MKTLQEIDYAPLKVMDHAWSKVLRDTFKLPPWVTITIAVVITAVGMYFVGQVALYLVILGAAYLGARVNAQKNRAWSAFAAANGWYVVPDADELFVPPGLSGIGRGRKLSPVVRAQFDGHECDLFMYQFTTGSGRSSTTHYYTIGRVLLTRPFPHLVLDSKSSRAIREHGTARQRVGLEGNFDKYFSLYCQPGEHIDALSIITPDVMHTLLRSNRPQDIEIIDQDLYFMMAADKRGPQALPPLLASIDALADQIVHKARTIRYNPPAAGNNSHPARTASAVASYFKSGRQVTNTLSNTTLLFIFLPVLLFIFFGFMMWALG